MPFVTPDRNRHQYIVGIDFGHGETSAAIAQIDWDASYNGLGKPFDVEFDGRSAMFSSFAQNKADNSIVYLGNIAHQYAHIIDSATSNYKWDFYAYFKDTPSVLRKKGQLDIMKTYMKSVYEKILSLKGSDGGPLTKDNHLVYIACPSSSKNWSQSEVEEYAKIASEAGLPLCHIEGFTNGIIRESRAAFLCARSQPNMTIDGILIVDFGSSTVDFTYYSTELTKPIDDGVKLGDDGGELGAQKIERLILDDISNTNDDIQALRSSERIETSLLLSIRQAKENYYKNNGATELVININLKTLTGRPNASKVSVFYEPSELETMSEMESYKVAIKNAFEKFKSKHLTNKEVRAVFLTGGASRMGWVKDVATSVFGEVQLPKEIGDPSTTISRGIALAGRADVRTISLEDSLSPYLPIPKNFKDKVIANAAKNFSLAAYDVIKEKVLTFKDSSSNYSIATLKEWIKDALKQISLDYEVINSYDTETRKQISDVILPQMNKLIHEYSSPDITIELPKTSTLSGSTLTNLSWYVDKVTDVCFEEVKDELPTKFLKSVVNALSTVGVTIINTAIAARNLVGHIINGEKSKDADFLDVEDAWIEFTKPTTILDANQRKRVYDAFIAAENSIKHRIELDVIFGDGSKVKDQISKAYKKDVESFVKSSIKKARLMLN